MNQLFTTVLAISFSATVFAQENTIEEIKALISKATIDQAEIKVNDILKKEPNNVDGLMLKGNIIYYKYSYSQAEVSLLTNTDESIFDNSIAFMGENVITVPAETANQVTEPWLKAVSIDKKRDDIHLGICHVYSISLQTDKLINYLPSLIANTELNDNSPYDFANYARNLKERDRFDDAMKVYQKLYELFPTYDGLLSDMAGEYFLYGNIPKAKEYADAAFSKPDLDAITCGNLFFIYAVMEEYPSALNAIQKKSKLTNSKEYLLYQGLLELNQENSEWKTSLRKYVDSKPGDTEGVDLANFLLSNNFSLSMDSYNQARQSKTNDGYNILIHKYYKSHTKEFLPAYYYAEAQAYNKRYSEAIKCFSEILTSTISDSSKQDVYFILGWSYYKNGDSIKANECWEKLLKSDKFFYKSAAAYFIGKYYFERKEVEKAKQYFSLVADNASESKYATYCWNMMK